VRHDVDVSRPFISRLERYASIDSTQRVVREWLEAGDPGVCVAVADEQTAGRGRQGRSWVAPSGAALLVSVGLRPRGLHLRHGWRLAATMGLAMVDAAEDVAGPPLGRLWLKWPNDIVADGDHGRLLKVAGVLGETAADDDLVASAVIGVGINADWRAADFPPDIAGDMTSLRELAGDRPVDRDVLLDAWLGRLEAGIHALDAGAFDSDAWSALQVTTGREVEVEMGDRRLSGRAIGVDTESGALLVESDGSTVPIDSGEVVRCRVAPPAS
jgi:BirA family biotin operon repressor/biotin-[acetyl-CoA-carboxylase] ligase